MGVHRAEWLMVDFRIQPWSEPYKMCMNKGIFC